MAKRITAKIDEYQKDGQTKGKYIEIGVIMSNANGEYMLLNPEINLAGVLIKQNALASKNAKPHRDNVMCSIYDSHSGQSQAPQANPNQSGGIAQNNNAATVGDPFEEVPF